MYNKEIIKLSFLGDVMCEAIQINAHYNEREGEYDFHEIFSDVADFFHDSDWVTANLETPVAGKALGYTGYTNEKWSFNTPLEFVKALKNSGVDLVSTANNHCLDRGVEGLRGTLEALDSCGLAHIGTYIDKNTPRYIIKDIKGCKIAYMSYTYGTNAFHNHNYLSKKERHMVNLLQNQELTGLYSRILYTEQNNFLLKILKRLISFFYHCLSIHIPPVYECNESNRYWRRKIRKEIKMCKKDGADFIAFCMHEGGQFSDNPKRRTIKNAEFLIKNGVNAVIGNHEHLVHPVDFSLIEKNVLKVYAQGNFTSIYGVYETPPEGFGKMPEYSVLINLYLIKKDGKAKIQRCTFSILKSVPLSQNKIKTVFLYDLINNCLDPEEKEKLMNDNLKLVNVVTGKNYQEISCDREYMLKGEDSL